MAGRPPEVDHVKSAFLKELKAAEDLVRKINSFKGGINPNGTPGLHPKYVRQVVELAFMGAVSSWEEFLERALVRYAAGAKTKAGHSPTPKYGCANSIDHAYQVLSGNPKFDKSKDYLKVSEPKWVVNTADFLFGAHGFGDIKTKSQLLGHANSIRNRVAHSSDKCRSDFKATAIDFLQPQNGKLTKGYGPGDLLMTQVIRHFGQPAVQAQKTHFDAYMDLFKQLANKAVP
ncbi:hypothetical protein [Halomonas sp. LBP4]|uniref:hypothetical protein n=1 Tax=Halomonas sp. LBP4 TaxID=2044917 RepID=UPI0011B4981B|nr:hypothetical protein [Halomonas sp. LBP4]